MNNPEATVLANVKMQSANTNAETKPHPPKRRSVNNMKPDALQKKRENDRNAQRNIREKQRRNLKMLQDEVAELKRSQDPSLARQLADAQLTIKRLVALLTQHGIEPGPAFAPIQDTNVLYRAPQPMTQPMAQSQPLVSGSLQYITESSPSHFTGSPESLGNSRVHSSPSLSESPHFPGQSQPMGTIQHMGALYSQPMPIQSTPAFQPMENTHPMTHPQSLGLISSTPQGKFETSEFQSFTPLEGWNFGTQTTQPQAWNNNATFRSNQVVTPYPSGLEDMTLARA
ncbi:hypothetical protein DID88_000020 [Monilinia fructigena]|uniref:BZIP domain-containing protein n=1 Tax=Monilinia fructigena TaxID=38457 RepID=A0A395IJ19_9HELO|nr:hypothetical protein DID88_000020 [Monilinia fructigena]